MYAKDNGKEEKGEKGERRKKEKKEKGKWKKGKGPKDVGYLTRWAKGPAKADGNGASWSDRGNVLGASWAPPGPT